MDFKKKLRNFILDMPYEIARIFTFIHRLICYIPIIWQDDDTHPAGLYSVIRFKLERMAVAQDKDTWHKDSHKYARQIRICLAYLDRYRNWPDYIEYPMDDISWEPDGPGLVKMVHSSSINEAKRKRVHQYEKDNYDMFWKRFMQWHQGWWT